MEKKRFADQPLLYIQQPSISSPVAPMQHNYFTSKQNKAQPTEHVEKGRRTTPIRRVQPVYSEEIVEEVLAEVVEEEAAEQSKFKEMTIKQKVDYFVNRPDYAPQLRCELKTNEKKHQGVITGFEDDHVLMRIGRRSSSSSIPLSEVIDIRLIGFSG